MTDKTECVFFLAINEEGEFIVDADEGEASNRLYDNAGAVAIRVIKLTALVKAPEIEEAEIDVPDAAGETTRVEVQAAE